MKYERVGIIFILEIFVVGALMKVPSSSSKGVLY